MLQRNNSSAMNRERSHDIISVTVFKFNWSCGCRSRLWNWNWIFSLTSMPYNIFSFSGCHPWINVVLWHIFELLSFINLKITSSGSVIKMCLYWTRRIGEIFVIFCKTTVTHWGNLSAVDNFYYFYVLIIIKYINLKSRTPHYVSNSRSHWWVSPQVKLHLYTPCDNFIHDIKSLNTNLMAHTWHIFKRNFTHTYTSPNS